MEKPTFRPSFWEELAEHNPLGMKLTGDDVRDWFDYVWLRYSTHPYRNHKRSVINWWSRVREEEIIAARERSHRIVDEAETAKLEAMVEQMTEGQHDQAQREAGVTRVDHFAKLRG